MILSTSGWLEGHPDLARSPEEAFRAGIERATRGWGKTERPKPLTIYQEDPIAFAVEILGIPEHTLRWSHNGYDELEHVWDGTKDPIAEMLEALARGENAGVESGTGTGKSFGLAIAILWFLACWEGARVYTFAPKEDQLRYYSWTELRTMWPAFKRHFPHARLTDLRIQMVPGSNEWSAVGWAVGVEADASVATKAAGMHAEHMLLIYEEGPGIPKPVYTTGQNTSTAEHNLRLAVGNPDHQFDPLHEFCTKPYVTHIRASALDAPNVVTGREVIPGGVGRRTVAEREADEGATGRLFLSHVRGISPSEAVDSLLRRSWLEAAAERWQDPEVRKQLEERGLPGLGVDVADSEGGDEAAIAVGLGAVLLQVDSHPCPDALKFAYQVQTEQAAQGALDRHVGVDSIGVGSNVVNKGKELEHLWNAINSSHKALRRIDEDVLEDDQRAVLDEGEYANLRAQMWWQLRVDFMRGRIAIPPESENEALWRELLLVEWTPQNGKVKVLDKAHFRKTMGRSPDKADAVCYWNWVRERRPQKPEEPAPSAFSPEMLEAEKEKSYRVHEKPSSPVQTPLDVIGY